MSPGDRKLIVAWLLICCLLTFSMIVLGGVTRLTQSGLSMVEWSPIMGVIPPWGEREWLEVFAQYQSFPEYQIVNRDMDLADFKRIFYVEYAHRVLGRTIGIVYLLPFLFFALSGKLGRTLFLKLLVPFVLGGLQGLMGWYMVQSGLVDVPRVSAYRLTAHLMLALLILGYMLWITYDLMSTAVPRLSRGVQISIRNLSTLVVVAVVLMVFTGGFVAGTRAGFAFNTFPTMAGQWVPDGIWALEPAWRNMFENIAMVQFVHRCIAYGLAILILLFWFRVRSNKVYALGASSNWLLVALLLQIGLGITTLLYFVPVPVAAAHQGGAMIVFSVALYIRHQVSHLSRGKM